MSRSRETKDNAEAQFDALLGALPNSIQKTPDAPRIKPLLSDNAFEALLNEFSGLAGFSASSSPPSLSLSAPSSVPDAPHPVFYLLDDDTSEILDLSDAITETSHELLNNGERETGNNDESASERLRRLAFNLQIAAMRHVKNKALIAVVDGQVLSLPLGFVIELNECLSPATDKAQEAGQLRTNHGTAQLIAMKKSKGAGLSHAAGHGDYILVSDGERLAALYVDCVLGVQSVCRPPSVASSYRDSSMGIRIMPIDVEQMLRTMFQER